MPATRRRGRHVQAVVPSLRRGPRCCPCNCPPTRLTMRHLHPWRRLSILRRRRWSRLEAASLQEPVGVAKGREAGEVAAEEFAEAAAAAGSVEAAAVAEAAEEWAEAAAAAGSAEAAAVAAAAEAAEAAAESAEAAAAVGAGRAHPLSTRRRRSRTEARGRARSEFAAAEASFLLETLDGVEKVRGKRRSNA